MVTAIVEAESSALVQDNDVKSRLLQLEGTIEQQREIGQRCYTEIGLALSQIKDERLWELTGHKSFVDYCQKVWGYEKNWANKLIRLGSFSELVEREVGTVVPAPISERHIRPLLRLNEADQVKVWVKAVEELPEDMTPRDITEDYIAAKVREHQDGEIKKLIADAPPAIKEQLQQITDFDPLPLAKAGAAIVESTLNLDSDDDTIETELIEDVTGAEVRANKAIGIQSKINALPKAEPYDFAIFQAKNLTEKTFVALDGLSRQVKEGGRVVVFCDPISAYQIVDEAAGLRLVIEHSLVRPVEVDPEFKNNYLFPVGHEMILVLLHGNESKDQRLNSDGVKNVAECFGNIPGTYLAMSVKDVAEIMLRAYCKAGDRVLCPTGGKHLINASIAFGDLDVTYLTADSEKFAWYQREFGATE